MKAVLLTRVYHLSAGHRLFDPRRDDAWNLRVFGKCSFPEGHGHNYILEVTVKGVPDPSTGFVARLEELDTVVEEEVMRKLDHRNLNHALSTDYGPAPTTEVLVLEVWRALEKKVRGNARLFRVRVSETRKNTFEYLGAAGDQRSHSR